MEIIETAIDKGKVLALNGKIDVVSAREFQQKYDELADIKTECFILDCSEVSYVSSAGLRVFLLFMKLQHKNNGHLIVCGLNQMVYNVFEISGFTTIFKFADTRDEELALLDTF